MRFLDYFIPAAIALAILFAGGCEVVTPPVPKQHAGVCWSSNISVAAGLWKVEAKQRFGARVPFVFICHGYRDGAGRWMCSPDQGGPQQVESVARILSDCYSDRPVLLIVCNPGHVEIHCPRHNVWYSMESVAVFPHTPLPGAASSIWEFRN